MTEPDETGFEPTRLRTWLYSAPSDVPEFDNPAFERMADVVMSAMASVGGPGYAVERTAVLERCLALVIAGVMRGATDDAIRETCADVGRILAGHVLAAQRAAVRDMRKAS